jgi:YggT family protein
LTYYLEHPLYTLGGIYLIILFLRAVMSWFPASGSSGLSSTVRHWLYALTEPYVAPFRKVIPPAGMFDISYMIAVLVVLILTSTVFSLVKV